MRKQDFWDQLRLQKAGELICRDLAVAKLSQQDAGWQLYLLTDWMWKAASQLNPQAAFAGKVRTDLIHVEAEFLQDATPQ